MRISSKEYYAGYLRFGVLAYFIALGLLGLKSATAQVGSQPNIETIIAGVIHERERLVSGEFSLVGTQSLERVSGEIVEVAFEDSATFAFDGGLKLYKHTGMSEETTAEGFDLFKVSWLICYRRDGTFHYESRSPTRYLYLLDPDVHDFSIGGWRRFFDPRHLGMSELINLYDGRSFADEAKRFTEDLLSGFESRTLADGKFELSKRFSSSTTPGEAVGIQSYVIDSTQGYSIIQHSSSVRFVDDDRRSLVLPSVYFSRTTPNPLDSEDTLGRRLLKDFSCEIKLKWSESNGVWVPSSMQSVIYRQAVPNGSGVEDFIEKSYLVREFIDAKFEWSAINEEIKDGQFEFINFGLPDGTWVFDEREAESRLIAKIGSKESLAFNWHTPAVAGITIAFLFGFYIYRSNKRSLSKG